MKKLILVFLTIVMVSGCATLGSTTNDPNASAQKWIQGAKWVLLVTDVMVPALCVPNGKMSPKACMVYYDASAQLKQQILNIEELMALGATPETITKMVATATATYLAIDAAYRGQL